MGEAVTALMNAGADNVQVIPTLTKKNRAGYVFLIDCPEANIEKVNQYLQRELSVGGYHILASTHVAQQSLLVRKKVEIQVGRQTLHSECVAKVLSCEGCPYSVKLERSSIIDLKSRLKSELGVNISAIRLEAILGGLWQEQLEDKITARLL